ncbi:MAG: protein kinase [Coriobacteriales bacterium]|jgi:serine/threonine protein kinase|nr:protein kinase [Coriobacteriales bacterium]
MALDVCLNCFKDKGDFMVCRHCGWVEGTPPDQAYHLHPGTVLAHRYVVGTVIGFGGFGVIYKVWDLQLSKVLAIKEFFPAGLVNRVPGEKDVLVFSGDDEVSYLKTLQRFLEEARNIARFNDDPNIINVLNYFEENNTAYIVMEYLEGISLSDYLLEKGGRLSPEEALSIIEPVMDGLMTIHKTGIIHRDIHPGNIFITTANQIKIIDFGAAKFSTGEDEKTLTVLVTQGYASPEQYRSKGKQGPYTDIYGLGATLYRMLTGVLPDEAPDRQVEDGLQKPSLLDVGINANQDNAIMRALAVDTELRFQKVSEFKEALLGNRHTASPEGALRRRRIRRGVLAAILTLVAIGGITAAVLFNTILKPVQTLENIAIQEETLQIWVAVDRDADTRSSQIEAYEAVASAFMKENKQISVDIVPVWEDEYDERLAAAFAAGTAPVLFRTDYSEDTSEAQMSSLDMLLRSLNTDDYLFLANYAEYYPEGKRIPLGFEVLVLYGNNQAAAQSEVVLPSAVTAWSQVAAENNRVAVNEDSLFLARALYGIELTAMDASSEDDGTTPLELFAADESVYYIDTTAALRAVQEALPGYYRVIPLENGGIMAGRFVDVWAVSATASENQQNAAMLFISSMLNSYSQNRLYLQNDLAIPLNRTIFADYLTINSEFAFLEDKENKFKFPENS